MTVAGRKIRAVVLEEVAQWHDQQAEIAAARARQHGASGQYGASSLAFMKRDAHEASSIHFRALATDS